MEEILYEDRDILVCRKRAGVPVQSARLGQKDMVSILNNYLTEKGEKARVSVVHRLDQPVEGALVFAKTKQAAAGLSRQLQAGSMNKIYQAVCCVQTDTFPRTGESLCTLVDYMVKDGRTNLSSVCTKENKDGKKAELEYSVLRELQIEEKTYLLVQIRLKTGRHHQIRVQMAHAGLPLYGDQKYNPNWQEYQVDASGGAAERGLALCAVSLSFDHPTKGRRMTIETEPAGGIFKRMRA